MNATISSRIAACLEQFKYMQSSGRLESREIEVPSFAWQDELGRLRLWVATTDAYQKTDFSLDHRLSDASHIKGQVIRQLDRLQRVLEDLQLALEEPFLEKTYSSETEDDEWERDPVYLSQFGRQHQQPVSNVHTNSKACTV